MRSPRVVTLPNGLRVILAPQPDAPTVTVLTMVRAGSDFEKPEESGVSHFLEHLAFKGSEKYPDPGRISHELETLGADNNAWTSGSHTAYWAKSQAGKAGKILEIMAELHRAPLIRADEVEKERGVILEEIAMHEDRPTSKVENLMQRLLYGDQPAGQPILGTKASVRGITREQVVAYRDRRYRAPETVIAIVGAFDEREALALLRARLGELDARQAVRAKRTVERQSGLRLSLMRKRTDQAHLQFAFRAVSIGHPLQESLYTLTTVLGSGASSRLFTRIREEMGAAYYVSAWNDFCPDRGTFGVSVGASLAKTDDVIRAVMEEFVRLRDEVPSPAEMRRARDFQTGMFLMGLESTDSLASHYAHDLLFKGRIVPLRESVRGIRSVTAEDVRRAARKVVRQETLNVAGLGPAMDEARIRKLLRLR